MQATKQQINNRIEQIAANQPDSDELATDISSWSYQNGRAEQFVHKDQTATIELYRKGSLDDWGDHQVTNHVWVRGRNGRVVFKKPRDTKGDGYSRRDALIIARAIAASHPDGNVEQLERGDGL